MNTKIWVVPMIPRVFLPMGICIQNQILNFLVSIKRSGTFMFKEYHLKMSRWQMLSGRCGIKSTEVLGQSNLIIQFKG